MRSRQARSGFMQYVTRQLALQLALVSKHLACRVPVATETNVVGDSSMSWSWPRYHREIIIRTNIYQSTSGGRRRHGTSTRASIDLRLICMASSCPRADGARPGVNSTLRAGTGVSTSQRPAALFSQGTATRNPQPLRTSRPPFLTSDQGALLCV